MEYTKYERARIIGARALQIAMGAPLLMKLKNKDFENIKFSPIEIAKKEFDGGFLPITIRKPMPRKV